MYRRLTSEASLVGNEAKRSEADDHNRLPKEKFLFFFLEPGSPPHPSSESLTAWGTVEIGSAVQKLFMAPQTGNDSEGGCGGDPGSKKFGHHQKLLNPKIDEF